MTFILIPRPGVPGHLKYVSPFPVYPVKTAWCKHCLMMSDSDFHCFCLPGGAAEWPLPSGSGIKELRPLPSGHAPPEPNKRLCDHPVLSLCPVIVPGSECFIYSFVFFIPVHLPAVPGSLGAVRSFNTNLFYSPSFTALRPKWSDWAARQLQEQKDV